MARQTAPLALGGNAGARLIIRLRRDLPLIALDGAISVAAYLVALALRFEGAVPDEYWANFWRFVPLAAALHLATNFLSGLYRQMWRYASVHEARRMVRATGMALVSIFLAGAAVTAIAGERPLPLSVAAMGLVLSAVGFGAVRFQSRLFGLRRRSALDDPTRVLIVGGGEAGSMVVKDLLGNRSLGLLPLAIIDDDPRKIGRSLHGVEVVGNRAQIPSLVPRLGVDQVLLAIPSATSEVVREVAAVCEEAEVTLRVLPSVGEVVGGRVTARDIRDLQIEDLLGRQQVQTDLEAVETLLVGRRVLVTGAGGSIGSEIVRQVLAFEPSALMLLDHDETHLHDVMTELEGEGGLEAVLADIRDRDRMREVLMKFRPDIIFHAAAHKHVPVLESYPEEALATNVIGTAHLADAAVAAGCGRFVLISTDKAINPVSVMGASKRFAEQVIWSLQGGGCSFCAVRFGNVVGSRGSVIPTFLRQISRGGPVTVTDPSMTRYFMSVKEAVQLVLQAAALSGGGEVFTLDMGEPVRILDLARKLIRLSGRIPNREVGVTIVGPRPGEKLVEDLVDSAEERLPSGHPGIHMWRPPPPDRAALRRSIHELEALAREGSQEELVARMKLLAANPADALLVGGSR
jgi:FlaA1/EpsC-like NDP-sugar epimerase